MQSSLGHIHRRQRANDKTRVMEPYPSNKEWVDRLDRTMLMVAIIGPFLNLPQILMIYTEHNVAGLAIATWIMLLFLKIPWIAYAFVHRAYPILITSTLWALSHILIIVGILIYR